MITSATANLLEDPPEKGQVQMIVRLLMKDKNMIDKAAYALGMTQANFTRMILVRATEDVTKQIEAEKALGVQGNV